MCADSSDPYMAKGIYHLEQNLKKNKYDVLLCCTGYQLKDKQKYMDLLISKRMDAIILLGSNFVEMSNTDNNYIKVASNSLPILLINGSLEADNIYSSVCDDYDGVYQACHALIQAGHKDIHFLFNANTFSGDKKIKGFLDAMSSIADPTNIEHSNIHFINGGIKESKEYLSTIFNEGIPVSAVMTADDSLAVGALKFANLHRLSIPDELAVIGYNNSILSTCSQPELTSIDSQISLLCHNGINILLNVLNQQPTQHLSLVPAQLIKRGSFL